TLCNDAKQTVQLEQTARNTEVAQTAHVFQTIQENPNAQVIQNPEPAQVAKPPQTVQTVQTNQTTQTTQIDHQSFDILLKKYVAQSGNVNYKSFKNSATDKAALEEYIKTLSTNAPTDKTAKKEKMAFWINAYNALTIKLILDKYPLSKITDLDGGKTWDVKRYTFDGKKLSLNDIENNILRPMGDARIHFAINCAAKSCPPLANEAFTAENLETLLAKRTKRFVNDDKANALKINEIKVSKIFEWYAKDFGNLIVFLNKYAPIKLEANARILYQEYDWRLNE
ncbi:MAG: DUF547 domain-containing protein, partial [Saprospiraceae bacterium]|nr:DUF547 domain-containing protein [Saprospiraceae bacterium]